MEPWRCLPCFWLSIIDQYICIEHEKIRLRVLYQPVIKINTSLNLEQLHIFNFPFYIYLETSEDKTVLRELLESMLYIVDNCLALNTTASCVLLCEIMLALRSLKAVNLFNASIKVKHLCYHIMLKIGRST